MRMRPRWPRRRRRGGRKPVPDRGLLCKGKGSGDQSWTRISTRCAHPTLAWKPKT